MSSRRCRLGILLLLGALWAAPAFAQGCAMCNANAKATPKDAQRAINRAIFVMLAPPVGDYGGWVWIREFGMASGGMRRTGLQLRISLERT